MVTRGTVRALAASSIAALLLSIGAAGVSAAEDCAVAVTPRVAPAGAVFTITGSGFTPTMLTLEKNGAAAGSHSLDLGSDDPWEFPLRSRPGDEGRWTAVMTSGTCRASAGFRVTLRNTDAASTASSDVDSRGVPLAALLLVVAAGATGGMVLGRRLQPVSRNNSWQ